MQDYALNRPSHTWSFVSVAMGLVWVAAYILLIAPVFIFSAVGGQWLGRVVWPGISPLFHGIAWIAGVLLITWLMRVKINKASWSGMALPRPQLLRLLLGLIILIALGLLALGLVYTNVVGKSPRWMQQLAKEGDLTTARPPTNAQSHD